MGAQKFDFATKFHKFKTYEPPKIILFEKNFPHKNLRQTEILRKVEQLHTFSLPPHVTGEDL